MHRRRRGTISRNGEEATRIARNLIQSSVSTAGRDNALAREQAALARRVMLKFNIRYPWPLRRFYCHGCKKLILPGMNARVRLGPNRMLLVTCKDCGRVNRKKLRQA